MDMYLDLFLKIFPLYILIALGYIASRYLHANKETIATSLIYIITPIVVFSGAITTKMDIGHLSLPVLFLAICSTVCLLFYFVGKIFFPGSEKNILAFASGSGNSGYFGLPVAIAMFGNDALGTVVLIIMGFIIFENTLGFFMVARGNYSVSMSLKKLACLPAIYTFTIGIALNLSGITLNQAYSDILLNVKGAYTVMGMMMVGMGIAGIRNLKIDWKFIALSFIAKFAVWPLIMLALICIDSNYLHLYDLNIYKILMLLSIVPLAANTVAYATELKTHPDKVAFAVLMSTLFAIVYIPFISSLDFLMALIV